MFLELATGVIHSSFQKSDNSPLHMSSLMICSHHKHNSRVPILLSLDATIRSLRSYNGGPFGFGGAGSLSRIKDSACQMLQNFFTCLRLFDVSSFVQIEWLRDNEEEGLRIAVSFTSMIPHRHICSLF